MRVLAGDVGGTNLRLAFVEVGPGLETRILKRAQVAVADHPGLIEPLRTFLSGLDERPQRACFGVAGTVADERRVEGLNLPWTVDASEVEAACGLERVRLVNDFYAAARGVECLEPDGWFSLNDAEPRATGPVAVLGAGTGLGEALLVPCAGGGRAVVPTEGGHRDFAPTAPLQDRLLAWLRGVHGRVSTERVLSGPGLADVYRFLCKAEAAPTCDEVEATEPAARPPVIARGGHPTCDRALELFAAVYGAEAGNLALTVLATGGVYLAGGIAPDLLSRPPLRARFLQAYLDKGRFADRLAGYPVRVVSDPDLGLRGAAASASGT